MRIAVAQINPTVGDFSENVKRIVRAALQARGEGAEITVFPELALCGYPPRDLLDKPSFIHANEVALERLKKALKGMPAFVGFVERVRDEENDTDILYNSYGFIKDEKVVSVGRKTLLPNYDVFDEKRHFQPAEKPTVVTHQNRSFGVLICEDAWNDKDFWSQPRYELDPVEEVVDGGADILLNPSASPFALGKHGMKDAMLSSLARKHRLPLIHINQVGGNDELIFDGRSPSFDGRGKLLARCPAFEEGLAVVSIGDEPTANPSRMSEMDEIHSALVLGLKDYARKCGFTGAVIGLSGGIDSAVTATLAAEAFGPENVIGISMPSRYNAQRSRDEAEELANNLGIDFDVLSIERPVTAFEDLLAGLFSGRDPDVTEENIQARTRGLLLMAVANKFNRMVLATGNKSEMAVGYCTLYGDMCGALAPIGDLYKTTVYTLAKHLNKKSGKPLIPIGTITRPPSAELRPDQVDQDSLPPYEELDGILKAYIEEHRSVKGIISLGFKAETVSKFVGMVDRNEFKRRQAAPVLRVTTKAFGMGRRLPIAQRFSEPTH